MLETVSHPPQKTTVDILQDKNKGVVIFAILIRVLQRWQRFRLYQTANLLQSNSNGGSAAAVFSISQDGFKGYQVRCSETFDRHERMDCVENRHAVEEAEVMEYTNPDSQLGAHCANIGATSVVMGHPQIAEHGAHH